MIKGWCGIMKKLSKLSALVISVIVFSFIGWLFEVLLFLIAYGGYYDRGFLYLPFCPIYGFTLLVVFLLFGTPSEGGLILSGIGKGSLRYILYFLLSSFFATIVELAVGWSVEFIKGRVLWDYTAYNLSIGKYACIEVSIVWGILICFASIAFKKLYEAILMLPKRISIAISSFGIVALLTDFIINMLA